VQGEKINIKTGRVPENKNSYAQKGEASSSSGAGFGAPDDRALVDRAKKGDKAAFEELVRNYSKYVYTNAFFMLRDTHDAEDISQEVFVKVYLSIKNFRGISSFKTWLRKLTINTCIDKLRVKSKIKDKKLELESFEDSYEVIFTDINHNIEKNFLTRETLREVLAMIVQMDQSYRIPLILRDLQDYSYREIAHLINKPIGTVKTNIHRARKIIKDKLKYEKENRQA
jgi:RNA polymerase sigma-70 factor, ECF subfamily